MAGHLAPAEPAVQPERLARMVLQALPAMVVTVARAELVVPVAPVVLAD